MTISTSVHSNAFNFMSFMEGGVDPRTGQYTVNLTLPDIKTNDLQGPGLPLSLGFNPMNNQDSGYGWGWNLQLSQFTPGNQILSLSTGETLKQTAREAQPDSNGRVRLYLQEQRLDTFHFYEQTAPDGKPQYRVVHKSGTVEVLAEQAGGTWLPIQIYAPSGHKITLEYTTFGTGNPVLAQVKDDTGTALLTAARGSNEFRITLAAGSAAPVVFVMRLNPSSLVVEHIELPTDDKASWWFDYELKNEYRIIKTAHSPVGGRETVFYEDAGHAFPNNSGVVPYPLPRVTRHITDPGFGQAQVEVRYTYLTDDATPQPTNFLGHGLAINYIDNGLDNLYRVVSNYTYQTVESLYRQNTAVRTVRRTFNQFHLLTRETTTQGSNIQTVDTDYGLRPGESFDAQPENFQLPKKVTTRWQVGANGRPRLEEVISTYDAAGNLTTQTQATGVVETSDWYPAEGEAGSCPADPEGFVRHLKEKRVTPASPAAGAPTLATRYTYVALPTITGSGLNPWLAPNAETLAAVNGSERQVLQHTAYTLLNTPAAAITHGRMAEQLVTMNGKETKTTYAYEKLMSEAFGYVVLQTTETLTGFDHMDPSDGARHVQKVIRLEHSLLNGEPLLNRDDNDVEIRYTYDVLRRVTSETVGPETDYEATRNYTYTLCDNSAPAAPRPQARQSMQDVKGVNTQTLFDGLNRVIEEFRDDADTSAGQRATAQRQTYKASYDLFGNLAEETEYDWFGAEQKPLKSVYEYDDWGAQRCVTGPDGVKVFEETDPVGTEAHAGPIQRSWREGGTTRTGTTETLMNLFEKPVQTRRFISAPDPKRPGKQAEVDISQHDYSYDGLGRTIKEIVGIDSRARETGFVYDAFDRLVENTLPDGAKVSREFATHSSDDLPVKITVALDGKLDVLGEQTFDGLGRMIRSITGGRTKTFTYPPGLSQPDTVQTPSGQIIEYTYNPQLGEEPITRHLRAQPGSAGVDIEGLVFVYDQANARLTECKVNDTAVLTRDYFTTGEVRAETQRVADQSYTMEYNYSRLGRLLAYTDVLGQQQTYDYDAAGRLVQTLLGTLVSAFTYDALGQPETVITHESADHRLAITLNHDEFGREILRQFEFGDTTQTLTQVYDDVDCLKQRTLEEGGALLRDETYAYDDRGRLVNYVCNGDEKPVDPAGNAIASQTFSFDGLDNITRVVTRSTARTNIASYTYGGAGKDPAQLQGVTNLPSGEPGYPDLVFEYDDDGNLTKDEQGRTLTYDALGRLTQVLEGANAANYQYDPLDKLSVHSAGANQDKLFYRDGVLANQVGTVQSSTFVRGGDHLLAEQRGEVSFVAAQTNTGDAK